MAKKAMLPPTGEWRKFDVLGAGGQGTVYLALNVVDLPLHPGGDKYHAIRVIVRELGSSASAGVDPLKLELELASSVQHYGERLGALKMLHSAEGNKKSLERMKREVEAVRQIDHDNLIKILKADLSEGWLVFEYYPRGTISDPRSQPKYISMYKGEALEALRALRGIVEALALLHEKNVVHRDVKPGNILVANDGRLVLADLGLVFFEYEGKDRTRVTETFESVGSPDWQPPWTMEGPVQLDQIDARWDVFAIGKILYCLIAGRRQLRWARQKKKGNNLEELFEGKPEMKRVNELLGKCIVEDKEDCLPDGRALLQEFDEAIAEILGAAHPALLGKSRRCRVCGVGHYQPLRPTRAIPGHPTADGALLAMGMKPDVGMVRAEVCDNCGHLDLFCFHTGAKRAWTEALPAEQTT